MSMEVIKGDLIELALHGKFDVIAHGCNCFNTQGAGIAKRMKQTFATDKYSLEGHNPLDSERWFELKLGDINKLGQIEYRTKTLPFKDGVFHLQVVNAYTQYRYGRGLHLDYEALTLCLRKINHEFKGKHIGLPWIGCGLAGGDKAKVRQIIKKELTGCKVTVVEYGIT